jgi:hypothetical protein
MLVRRWVDHDQYTSDRNWCSEVQATAVCKQKGTKILLVQL